MRAGLSETAAPAALAAPPMVYPLTSMTSCTVPREPLKIWTLPSAPTGAMTALGMFWAAWKFRLAPFSKSYLSLASKCLRSLKPGLRQLSPRSQEPAR